MERYRKWQAERDEAFGAGVKAAADLVKNMIDESAQAGAQKQGAMAISKAERAPVFAMFVGNCAYCREPLPERWHADHLEPVQRDLKMVSGERS